MAPAPAPTPPNATREEDDLRGSLLSAFTAVKDPRDPHGRRFPLPALLSLIVIALLSGCKNPTQIYNFAKAHRGLLPKLGFRPPVNPRLKESRGVVRTPNEDTITYVLGRLDPDAFVGAFAAWVNVVIGPKPVSAAVDGKALCATGEHVLTVFAGKLRLALWQKEVGEKENEYSAFCEALSELLTNYPGLKLLTGDAMFCQKVIAEKIIEARRDYLLQLKAPHTTDCKIADKVFEQQTNCKPALATSGPEKRGPGGGLQL